METPRALSPSLTNDTQHISSQNEKRRKHFSSSTTIPILILGGLIAVTGAFLAETTQRLAWTQRIYPTGAVITVAGAGVASLVIVVSMVALSVLAYLGYLCVKRVL